MVAVPTASPSVPGATSGITAFVDVAVIPMDHERVLQHQTVLVRGGRIGGLGPVRQIHVPAEAVRIDGRGKYLIPGLADMHTHVGLGDSAAAEPALLLWLANGVTTIRNMDYLPPGGMLFAGHLDGPSLLRLRARTAIGTLISPRIYTSGPWGPPQYLGGLSAMAVGRSDLRLDSIATYVAAYKAAGYDHLKIHDESAVVAESVVVAAHRVGIPVVGHIPVDLELERALQIGYTSIEHLTGYLIGLVRGSGTLASKERTLGGQAETVVYGSADGTPLSDSAFLALMRQTLDFHRITVLAAATRRAGVWNCPTLELQELASQNIRTDTLARWPEVRYVSAKKLGGWETWQHEHSGSNWRIVNDTGGTLDGLEHIVRALQDSGAGLLSGTDASSILLVPYLVPGFSLHRELAALVQAGLTPYQALATSTRNVAAYFGTSNETGTVSVGKRADLVLLGGNPLQNIRQTAHIAGVMHDGRWFPEAVLAPRVDAALRVLEASHQ